MILIGLLLLLSAHQMLLMQSVEHAAEPGWVNLQRYLRGKPLGVHWQMNAALHLLQDPMSLLSPRPYVAQERQTVLVNLLAGVRSLQSYLIPGVAVLLTPLIACGGAPALAPCHAPLAALAVGRLARLDGVLDCLSGDLHRMNATRQPSQPPSQCIGIKSHLPTPANRS